MIPQHSRRITWFVFGITAATLTTSLPPALAASSSDDSRSTASSVHSREAMQSMARLQPKRVVTVTGNEDWDSQRGFGKDSAMAEMMTLMMVGGSGMEHMKMGPIRKGGMPAAGMSMGDIAMGTSGRMSQPQGLPISVTVTPDPPIVGENTLDIAVTDGNGKPVTGVKLTAAVAMTSMDMGTEHPKVTEAQDGHYTVVVNFSMKGPWRVTLTGSAPGSKTAAMIHAALDFNAGSTQTWSRPAGPKASQPAGPQVELNTPADTLKVGKSALEFTIRDAAGKPITGAKVTAAVAMTSMDMGTAHPQVREGKDGRYTTEVEFSMAGPWRVTLTIAPPNRVPPEARGMQFTRALDLSITK